MQVCLLIPTIYVKARTTFLVEVYKCNIRNCEPWRPRCSYTTFAAISVWRDPLLVAFDFPQLWMTNYQGILNHGSTPISGNVEFFRFDARWHTSKLISGLVWLNKFWLNSLNKFLWFKHFIFEWRIRSDLNTRKSEIAVPNLTSITTFC